jgi:hypothetical protein
MQNSKVLHWPENGENRAIRRCENLRRFHADIQCRLSHGKAPKAVSLLSSPKPVITSRGVVDAEFA